MRPLRGAPTPDRPRRRPAPRTRATSAAAAGCTYVGDFVNPVAVERGWGARGEGVEQPVNLWRTALRGRTSTEDTVSCGERHQDACPSRRARRRSKIFWRPTWPLAVASSRWRWRVGLNSRVVTK